MSASGSLAADGRSRIDWAARGMPVLATIAEELAADQTLAGLRVGVGLVLEPKTANLAFALQRAGAEVSMYCSGHSTTGSIAAALADAGMRVFAEEDADDSRDLELAREYLKTGPDVLLDDGAEIIRLAHREFPELVDRMRGASEETTSGVRPLTAMHADGALRIPVIAVNDARTKYLFDNVYGTGQSCVMALLDLTNLQLAGKVVAVVGYGWVGRGVAACAAALGARVTVSELDPIKALQALHDGYRVQNLDEAAGDVEILFAATGIAGAVTEAHLARMRDGVILCTAGGGAFELPMDHLHGLGTGVRVREAIDEYTHPDGRRVLVISDGDCLNCADAEGNPIEVMDLSLSLQALAVKRIVTDASEWGPGIYPVPPEMEESVARIRLRHAGASLQPLTDELQAAMRRW